MRHVFLHRVDVVGDDHGASTEHIAGANQHRQTDFTRHARGFFGNERRAVPRLWDAQFVQQAAEPAPVFREVDGFRRCADDGDSVALQFQREVQRRLPSKLHDNACGLFPLHDGENIFQRQRLEVQAIGSVVIGRDRFRIAIYHDGLKPIGPQRERSVAAAVIEFNTLPDAIGATSQNHDFLLGCRVGFVFFLVG